MSGEIENGINGFIDRKFLSHPVTAHLAQPIKSHPNFEPQTTSVPSRVHLRLLISLAILHDEETMKIVLDHGICDLSTIVAYGVNHF